jgi:F-type H+-transporting ATPase subunit epsilon
MANTIKLEVVTPERKVIDDQAIEVQVPGRDGYLGILPGHAPLITELAVGEIAYRNSAGESKRLAVAWGFAEVLPDKVTILAEVAEKAEEIDVNRAQQAKQRAQSTLGGSAPDDAKAAAQSELERAENRLAVVEKLNGQMANLVP